MNLQPKGIQQDITQSLLPRKNVKQLHGNLDASALTIGIAISRYNPQLTHGLLEATLDALETHGTKPENITIAWVPGAYEIPLALQQLLLQKPKKDALIALGAVLEGKTNHAQLISQEIARAITKLTLEHNCPIIDTVVTADTLEDAAARCLSGEQSRGWYAGLAAIEMGTLMHNIKS